ncbi:hypothetical protein BC829DRAFT_391285 [Chytridium lagenaria]|nr:hypothetical protein BC829DRAFT_391285 [Chytridium lagenaria]
MYFKDGSQKDSILTRWIRKSVYDHHHVILYFLTIGSLSYVYLSRIDDVGSNLFWSSQRPILVRQESFFVREAFTDLIRTFALNMSQVSESLTSVSTFVPFVERSILYGSSDLHLEAVMSKGYNDPHARLELQNACVTESPSDCDVFESSVMKRGLHAATISLRLTQRQHATMSEALTGLIDWFLNLKSSKLISCSISYVLLLLAFYLFVIRPLLKAIAEDMKRTAALIYMLPSQVFTEVPTFRRWIEKQMNGESTSSARNLKMDAKSIRNHSTLSP